MKTVAWALPGLVIRKMRSRYSLRFRGELLPQDGFAFRTPSDTLPRMTNRVIFQWVAWLLVTAVVVFTVAPIEFRPNTGAPASLERFIGIAMITGAFCLGYPKHRIGILVLIIGAVGFLEVIQDILPGRHGRKVDLAIKVAGALLGGASAMMFERLRKTA